MPGVSKNTGWGWSKELVVLTFAILISGCSTISGVDPLIKYEGFVGDNARVLSPVQGETSTSNQFISNVQWSSYLWQKWMATVNGSLDIAYDNQWSDQNRTDATALGGSLAINILPYSFVPTGLMWERTNTRFSGLDGDFDTRDLVVNRYVVGSNLSLANGLKVGGSYTWSDLDESNRGTEDRTTAMFSISKSFGKHNLSSSYTTSNRNFDGLAGDDFDEDKTIGNFSYSVRPSKNSRFEQRFVYSNEEETEVDTHLSRTIWQGLGTYGWRPAEKKWSMNAGYRWQREALSSINFVTDTQPSELVRSHFNSSASFNYPIRRGLTATAFAGFNARWQEHDDAAASTAATTLSLASVAFPGMTTTNDDLVLGNTSIGGAKPSSHINPSIASTEDEDSWSASFGGGLGYSSKPLEWDDLNWQWRARATSQNIWVDSESDFQTIGTLSTGHTLSGKVDLPLFGKGNLNMSQDLRVNLSNGVTEDNYSLTTYGSVSRSRSTRETRSLVQLSLNDTETVSGGDIQSAQTLSFLLYRSGALTTRSGWRSDLNISATRSSDSGNDEETEYTLISSGGASYWHSNIFDVSNLIFRSDLTLRTGDLEDLLRDDDRGKGIQQDVIQSEWRNRLIYRIGRVAAEVEARAIQQEEGVSFVGQVRIRRYFDNYN